jgi:hypothetical protein
MMEVSDVSDSWGDSYEDSMDCDDSGRDPDFNSNQSEESVSESGEDIFYDITGIFYMLQILTIF